MRPAGPSRAGGGKHQPRDRCAGRREWPGRGASVTLGRRGPPRQEAVRSISSASREHPVIGVERAGDVVVDAQLALCEHGAAVAILPHRSRVVRHQDDVRPLHAFAKRGRTFAAKPLVADFRNLVDQINIEIDSQAGTEGETRAHPSRVGINRHIEILAEFSKIGDIADSFGADRRHRPGQETRHSRAPKANRGTYRHSRAGTTPVHHAGILPRSGSSDPASRRISVDLPAPLPPRMPDIATRRERRAGIVEHDSAALRRPVGLGDAVERDHCGSLNRRRRQRSSPRPARSARAAQMTRNRRSSQWG